MMGQAELQHRVIELIAKQYQDTPGFQENKLITAETSIRDDLEFDSLMMVVLQIEIEDAFHIRFDSVSEDMQKVFSSVGTLCSSIQKNMDSLL